MCSFQCSLPGTIRIHKESVHMKVMFSCKKCTYQATQRTHLRTHEKSIHEGIKHQCKVCKAEFTQKTHLKTHVKGVHIQEKKFACDSCTFKTHATKNLKYHINAIHQNIKYPCNYCDQQAAQKSALTVHIKRNHREKHYNIKCPDCDFKTYLKANLKDHSYKHKKIMYSKPKLRLA